MNQVTDLVKAYPSNQFTVMALQEDLAPHEHTRYEIVQVHIDAKQAKRGDVHIIDGGCYLAKNAVDRVAVALGVIFDPDRTKVEKLSKTEWVGRAVAARRNPDGTWIIRTGEYEWDAELRAEIDAKGDVRKEERLTLQYRMHGRQRAETGAKSRAIRALTAIKTSYSKEELAKPLVFVRHTVTGDAPEHLRISGQQVWHAPQTVDALPAPADDEDVETVDGEVVDDDVQDATPAADADIEKQGGLSGLDDDHADPVDPLGDAMLDLGFKAMPKGAALRVLELYADERCVPVRGEIKGAVAARIGNGELGEPPAAAIVRSVTKWLEDNVQ